MADTSRILLNRSFSAWVNVVANIGANGIVAIAFLVYVPLLIAYVGIEGFGLVGVYLVLQTVLTVFDLGLSVSLNREFAMRASDPERASEMRDLLRTSEVLYWLAALSLTLILLSLAAPIASLINPAGLSYEAVFRCFLIMSVALGLHFPIALYSGGLYGIQRQVQVSVIFVVFSLFKTLGAVIVLGLISPTLETFFVWQAICAALHCGTLAIALRLGIPPVGSRPRFRTRFLKEMWKFTTGVALITIVATLISQIDKAVLVRILSLENFGYYSIAAVLSANVQRLIQPVFQAYFPRLSELTKQGDRGGVSKLYHQGSQLLSVVVLPVCAIFVFFSSELLFLWQRNEMIVANTHLLVALLMAGSALNSLLYLPYALQLANGWTRLQIVSQISLGAISVPLTVVLSTHYGGLGAAAVWIAFNAAFILVSVPAMHRRLLSGGGRIWAVQDVLKPLAAISIAALAFRFVLPETRSIPLMILELGVAYTVTLGVAIAVCGEVRGLFANRTVGASRQRP